MRLIVAALLCALLGCIPVEIKVNLALASFAQNRKGGGIAGRLFLPHLRVGARSEQPHWGHIATYNMQRAVLSTPSRVGRASAHRGHSAAVRSLLVSGLVRIRMLGGVGRAG